MITLNIRNKNNNLLLFSENDTTNGCLNRLNGGKISTTNRKSICTFCLAELKKRPNQIVSPKTNIQSVYHKPTSEISWLSKTESNYCHTAVMSHYAAHFPTTITPRYQS